MPLGHNIKRLREQYSWSLEDLASRSGVERRTVHALEHRDSKRSEYAAVLAQALGVPVGELLLHTPPQAWDALTSPPVQHHPLSQQTPIVTPTITWEDAMHHPLPVRFELHLVDDSMTPRVRRGDAVLFSTDEEPRPGDGILVRDRYGSVHFRLFTRGAGSEWSATALNPGYQTLHSDRDGLTILAVLVGIQARWSTP